MCTVNAQKIKLHMCTTKSEMEIFYLYYALSSTLSNNIFLRITPLTFINLDFLWVQKTWTNALKDCNRFVMSLVNLQDDKYLAMLRELTKSNFANVFILYIAFIINGLCIKQQYYFIYFQYKYTTNYWMCRCNIPCKQNVLDCWFFISKTREFLVVLNFNWRRGFLTNKLDERSTSIQGKRLSRGIFSFHQPHNWKANSTTSKYTTSL
jgi:hypothetical protein